MDGFPALSEAMVFLDVLSVWRIRFADYLRPSSVFPSTATVTPFREVLDRESAAIPTLDLMPPPSNAKHAHISSATRAYGPRFSAC